MVITSHPIDNTLYFQKSVPDIVIHQTTADASVVFVLFTDGNTILSETCSYDQNGKIQIREIYKICEKYLNSAVQIKDFQCEITEGSATVVFDFSVLKCESEIAASAGAWCAANFLTRSFREKRTAAECNESLSFLQLAAHGVLTPHYEITYEIGGVVSVATGTLATIATKTTATVVALNTSCAAIRTAAAIATGAQVLNYKIWLTVVICFQKLYL